MGPSPETDRLEAKQLPMYVVVVKTGWGTKTKAGEGGLKAPKRKEEHATVTPLLAILHNSKSHG